jgi:hypothetical protein
MSGSPEPTIADSGIPAHRPADAFQFHLCRCDTVVARVFDNIATRTTTPALKT